MTSGVEARAQHFAELHRRPGAFILPNPWDAGSARLLAAAGFEALGTTSLGVANGHGRAGATIAEILDNARAIIAATDLPVTVDLENCGAEAPQRAADVMRAAAELGAAGASIEDASGDPQRPVYEFSLAVERVAACVESMRGLGRPFQVTARADGLICGNTDIDDVIRRLLAFEEAGADVLYAPGLRSLEAIQRVASVVHRPVNVVMTFADPNLTKDDLASAGARRISIGVGLSRYVLGAALRAMKQMMSDGSFLFIDEAASSRELQALFSAGAQRG